MKIIKTAQYEGRYDDLLEDYMPEEDVRKARQIFNTQGEDAVEEWLTNVKGLDYGDARACVRALGS